MAVGKSSISGAVGKAIIMCIIAAVIVLGLIFMLRGEYVKQPTIADVGVDGIAEPVVVAAPLPALCPEYYMVSEGETLHTISDKCGDLLIMVENPGIDEMDVVPGSVLKLSTSRKMLYRR